jgi:hypothetical protein
MVDSLLRQLDQFGRRHPNLMLCATIVLAIFTTLVLIYNTKDTAIVYRAF